MPAKPAYKAIIDEIRSEVDAGKRIVFVSGNFNVIHPGHQRILSFAASCGDFLVVGVNPDHPGITILPAELRRQGIAALSVVNHAFVLDGSPDAFIRGLRPAFVVKGAEYRSRFNVEQQAVDSYGGKLLFCSGDIAFSSLELLRDEFRTLDFGSISLPSDYPQRHGFAIGDLVDVIRRFPDLRVVVVGDLIVDSYIECQPLGMSREDPTLVVSPIAEQRFLGGAGIVAAHARALGAKVTFFSVADEDPAAAFAEGELAKYGVEACLMSEEGRPTTLKQRFRAAGKALLRVSHLRQHDIGDHLIEALFARIAAALADADLLILSDFNYGCLPQPLVERIAAACGTHGVPMAADSQSSSQIGDISRFRDTLLITPTEHEARLALRDQNSGLVVLADRLLEKCAGHHVLVTLGGEGILIRTPSPTPGEDPITDRLPAFNTAPRDVSGAGDCLLTCTAMALVAGADIWQGAYLGSAAAACQVGRVGNLPLAADDLIRELVR